MGVFFGKNTWLGVFKEGTYNEAWATGTPAFVNCFYIDPDFKLDPTYEPLKSVAAHGKSILQLQDVNKGAKSWTLSFSGKLPKERFGYILLALMGKVDTTTGAFQTHLFNPSNLSPCSLKVCINTKQSTGTDTEWHLSGGKVKSIEFRLVNNAEVTYTVEMIGGNWVTAASGTYTPGWVVPAGTENPYYWFNDASSLIQVTVDSNVHTSFNSVVIKVENMLADSAEESYDWGSASRVRLERASTEECIKCSIKLKRIWSTETSAMDFINRISLNTFVNFYARCGLAGATGYGFNWEFDTRLLKAIPTPKGLGLMEEEIELEGISNAGAMTDWAITTFDLWTEPADQEG